MSFLTQVEVSNDPLSFGDRDVWLVEWTASNLSPAIREKIVNHIASKTWDAVCANSTTKSSDALCIR